MEIQEQNLRVKDICKDIEDGEIDLKPEFQRGEVWTSTKKKLLIDSILRDWHIPPIHIVEVEGEKQEVLDGQQRLAAIRDFLGNRYAVDGSIEPYSHEISQLDKLKYKDLPTELRRKVDRYSLKVYLVKNYAPGEPNELFHRLNQTVKLTSAETRNSIFGDVRNDISSLVDFMDSQNVNKEIIGFSNSRMAYNDLISRIAMLLEKGSIRYQLTESTLNERYRGDSRFSVAVMSAIRFSISFFGYVKKTIPDDHELNLTKASTLSWCYALANARVLQNISESDFDMLQKCFLHLELAKSGIRKNKKISSDTILFTGLPENVLREILFLYIERSSSRVMSTGSVLIRDIIINIFCFKSGLQLVDSSSSEKLSCLASSLGDERALDVKEAIETFAQEWRSSDENE